MMSLRPSLRKMAHLCVKCQIEEGSVKFPYSNARAKLWSTCVAVGYLDERVKQFTGKKSNFLCEVGTEQSKMAKVNIIVNKELIK
jgi:hypothetical protein